MSKSVFVSVIAVIVAFLSVVIAVAGTAIQGVLADAAVQMTVLSDAYHALIANAPFLGEVLPVVGGFVGLLLVLWMAWMLVCPAFRR